MLFSSCGWLAGIACEHWLGGQVVLWLVLLAVTGGTCGLLLAIRNLPGDACDHAVDGTRTFRFGPITSATTMMMAAACAGGFASSLTRAVASERANFLADDEVVLEGVIARPVEDGPGWRRGLVEIDGRIEARSVHPARGRLLVTETGDLSSPAPLPGDRVRFRGVVREPVGYLNEGAFDRATFLLGRGVDGLVTARAPGLVKVDEHPRWGPWRLAAAMRDRASQAMARTTSGHGGALLQALVLGRRGSVEPSLEAAFRDAGVSHVLSVSGLHLAAIALLLYELLRRAWLLAPALAHRIPAERAAAIFSIPAATGYTLLTGAETATVRALVVTVLFLFSAAIGRRADALTSLAVASLAILAATPWALFEPSFQLSFAASFSLATLAVRWAGRVEAQNRLGRARRAGWRLLVASCAATVATMPFTALHFGVVQPAGLVANLLVVPVAELVVLPLGLAGALAAVVFPAAGIPACRAAGIMAEGLAWLVQGIAAHAPVLAVPPPKPWEMAGLLVGIVLLAFLRPGRRALLGLLVPWGLVAISMVIQSTVGPRLRRDLTVTFLDVGQGDAAVLEAPQGETWLVDAGGPLFTEPNVRAHGQPRLDPGEEATWRFLRARRIRRLDVVIISHPHPDHYLGLRAVASHVPIGELWVAHGAADEETSPAWSDLLASLVAQGTRVVTPPVGLARERGGARIVVLWPRGTPPRGFAEADSLRTVNDNSLVVRVEHAGRSILLAGDVEREGETELLGAVDAAALDVDVVKVPHHGSRTSSTSALVQATSPSLAVISCGRKNSFRFPAEEVVQRWRAAQARVLSTDADGAITVRISPSGQVDAWSYRNPRWWTVMRGIGHGKSPR
ncbi:MAG: DNA internalization-related competence protein ComEC/Rec2 [Deltaproteobacteria bacterium]|nr:DNA internalization-related competence protein ComEC/Rec2 [Deltaproteobacteria bacterium]